ncbi:MAG: thiamine diphosphokinase [Sphaerochaetaceae bacterium]
MKKWALLFTGGKSPSLLDFDRALIPVCDFIYAADSGLDIAHKLGFKVDLAIGDFDSIQQKSLLDKQEIITLPKEKDITDTEALLQLIEQKEIENYILIGGGEGRFDHLLHLYSLFSLYKPPQIWITAQEIIYLAKESFSISNVDGKSVSIIPAIHKGSSRVSSKNLKWELNNLLISMDSQSISNVVIDDKLLLKVEGNPVFVTFPYKTTI